MTTDLTEIYACLDAYEAFVIAQALRGLDAVTTEAEESMRSTLAHGDQTGATRAGYRAYAVGPGRTGSAELLGAVAAVDALNPGHAAVSHGSMGAHSLGVIFTCPTDYQQKLETERAGLKAVLGPTLDAFRDELTARAAKGA
jgi:hypothetical protein